MPVITGTNSGNTLTGTADADEIFGLGGADTIDGAGGDDRIDGGSGDDTLTGGPGSDVFVYSERRFGDDVITDFGGGDRIDLSAFFVSTIEDLRPFIRQSGPNAIIEFRFAGNSETITLRNTSAQTLTAANFVFNTATTNGIVNGTSSNDVLFGGLGNDQLFGERGSDTLVGGAGNDYLDGGNEGTVGGDNLTGGLGADIFAFTGRRFGDDTITDFSPGDRIDLSAINITNIESLRPFIRQVGADTVIEFRFASNSETITIQNVRAATLTSSQFIFNTAPFALTVVGENSQEYLFGGSGSDRIEAGGGDDRLMGGGGSDIVDGGSGFDTAFYVGARRSYIASSSSVSGGPEGGTDQLFNVEEARFADGVLTFDPNSLAAQVMRLYDAALDRLPDQSGFEANLDALERGTSLNTLASAFLNSPEFQARYGALNNRQFIEQMYRFCLNREGDAAGIQTWTDRLNSGTTRTQMLVIFSESDEHKALTAGAVAQGLWVADDQALQIARMYDATFDRLADSGGLALWTANLKGGMSLLEIATAFAFAPEFQQRYGAVTNEQFIRQMYQFCLNRQPDAEGLAFWVNALNTGTSRAQMLLNFSESAEHVALTRELWIGGVRTTDAPGSPLEEPVKGLEDALVLPGAPADAFIDLADPKDAIVVCLDDLDATAPAPAEAEVFRPLIHDGPWALIAPDFDRVDPIHRIDWQTG